MAVKDIRVIYKDSIARLSQNHPGASEVAIGSFFSVLEFLDAFPDFLSLRGAISQPGTSDYFETLASRFFSARERRESLQKPATVPDEIVSYILKAHFEWDDAKTSAVKEEHQWSMAAENIVGSLLERYIASVVEPLGWAWCSGDFIRAVDFLRYEPYDWKGLQVKNRDNTENSSSSKIRQGRDIEISKWFRTFSKKAGDNWAAFPAIEGADQLSEEGFRKYVKAALIGRQAAGSRSKGI